MAIILLQFLFKQFFNISSPLPDHSIYVPGLIHKSPKDSLPGNLRGRYPSGHLLHFRWILPVTVKNPHKSCIFCTFMRVLYFCVIFTNSQLNYAFICFANYYKFPLYLQAFRLSVFLIPKFSYFKMIPLFNTSIFIPQSLILVKIFYIW